MARPDKETLRLAKQLTEELAGVSLPPIFAKLYSQHTRLRESQPGLYQWREQEATDRLNDALRILEASFVEKEAESENWQSSMRRVGELLEWLSHPQLNPDELPIRLLAAAAYQLAGFPARATGLLNESAADDTESGFLRGLLQANFPYLFHQLIDYWGSIMAEPRSSISELPWHDPVGLSSEFHRWIVLETASALGVLNATMRWGNEPRLNTALEKINAIAKVLIHGEQPYSWLLAKFSAEVVATYFASSLRNHLSEINANLNQAGKLALEQYLRQGYQNKRALAWPSQITGIERLSTGKSFALCTPTGSGKTTVAEIALLQSLFSSTPKSDNQVNGVDAVIGPLAIYLVPSRALAAEVEHKLSHVLRRVEEPVIVVTGLYGGTDWGPTDFWLTIEDRTILICTYEKAEALLRFIGPVFLSRIRLIVIDEAHKVEFDGKMDSLRNGDNRTLHLEALGTRLLSHLGERKCRIIALSAVAAGIENTIAKWITGQDDATPATHPYRSTRQLIGRLECLADGKFDIRYDLLDGASLEFQEGNDRDSPYIQNAFPPHPSIDPAEWHGLEKQLRPYLFWSAMNLAAIKNQGQQRSVLISITQKIEGFAKDFLYLLDEEWKNETRPTIFKEPEDAEKLETWQNCLKSCADYFGQESHEYRLLSKGIAVHHGRMPGSMARLLVRAIENRIIHIVLATSTLSEGVNLPFETILIPTLRRTKKYLDVREFGNLVGRAGRPGFGTEGRSLVLLGSSGKSKKARNQYFDLVDQIINSAQAQTQSTNSSPLATLLSDLEAQWRQITHSQSHDDFLAWLEQVKPLSVQDNNRAIDAVDTLDGILLSAIEEIEQLENEELSTDRVEEKLKQVWQHSYAHYASNQEANLEQIFIRRGKALKSDIYPDKLQRRRLYRTSLPPRSGNQVINLYPAMRQLLETGREYALWDNELRFNYVRRVVELIQTLPRFGIVGQNKNRDSILRWWLDRKAATIEPSPTEVANWHKFINDNFYYRFNWGLGSILALAIDEAFGQEIRVPTIDDWTRTGLPWIAFWMKELIVWGTLDPVAAYLLTKSPSIVTREDAETIALQYYQEQSEASDPNEILKASKVLEWTKKIIRFKKRSFISPQSHIKVTLIRDFSNVPSTRWRVLPIVVNDVIRWTDPAGFPLAESNKPDIWESAFADDFDFLLDPAGQVVISSSYLGAVGPAQ